MAVVWMEGFDLFGDVRNVFRKYFGNTHGSLSLVTPGRTTGDALMISRTNDINIFTSYPFDASSPLILGFGLNVQGSLVSSRIVNFNMMDAVQVGVNVTSAGRLQFYDGENNLLGQTNAGIVSVGSWNYIEVKITVGYGNGQITLRVNNSVTLALSNVKTQADAALAYTAAINNISFLVNLAPQMDIVIDDIYALNTLTIVNNDFLGSVSVEGYLPSGETLAETSQWVATDAPSNYQAVNERPPDDDTTYIETSSDFTQSYFSFPALTGASPSEPVYAIELNILGRKTGSGATKIYPAILYNSIGYGTNPFPLADQYLYGHLLYNTNPISGTWDINSYNASYFGVSSDPLN